MPFSGADVSVAIGTQSNATTEATTVHAFKATRFGEFPGRQVYQGEPEVAGGLYTGKTALVVGAIPQFSLAGIGRTGISFLHLLGMAGFDKTITGDGSATPHVITMNPVTAGSSWDYKTLNYIANADNKYSIFGARFQEFNYDIAPQQPIRWSGRGIGLDHKASSLTHTADEGAFEPTPAVAGTVTLPTGFTSKLYGFGFSTRSNLNTEQIAIGQINLDDNTPTALTIRIRGRLVMNDEEYEALAYGAVGGTQMGAQLIEEDILVRVNSPANISGSAPYATPAYHEISCSTAKIWLDQEVEFAPERVVFVDFVGVCTGTFGFAVVNGEDGTAV